MIDAPAFRNDLSRYAKMMRNSIGTPAPFSSEKETDQFLQVERGVTFPAIMINPAVAIADEDRLINATSVPASLPNLAVVDRLGHRRPVYRPLLIYSWLQTFRLAYEALPRPHFSRWEEAARVWCDFLEADIGKTSWPEGGMPAARGAQATESAWTALALHVAGKVLVRDVWTELASDIFGHLVRGQRDDGSFLTSTSSDNPETNWYHELVLLHAAGSYAIQSEDRAVAAAVAQNSAFHQNLTQPDHATAQPWGLFAFIWNPATRPLAEQLLHSITVQHPEGPDGVSLMLLGDALYSLQLFGVLKQFSPG